MPAAAVPFIENCVYATTVDDIVAKAGVAKGTFYHYFATKADVLLALRARFSQDFTARAAIAIEAAPQGDHHARFIAWLRAAVAAYVANFRLHDVVFHDFTHDRRRSQDKDMVIDQLSQLLSAASRQARATCRMRGLPLSYCSMECMAWWTTPSRPDASTPSRCAARSNRCWAECRFAGGTGVKAGRDPSGSLLAP